MNSDWRLVNLGEVLTLQRGYDLPTSARHVAGNIPVISSSGISGFHDVYKVEPPGVVTGRYGSVGAVFYVTQPFWPLNTTLYVRDFKGNYPLFVYYLLQSVDFDKFSDKTSVPGVNRNDIHRLPVLLPSLSEQHCIADILAICDHAIDLTAQLIAAKQQHKRGLMQQLLTGKRRFPTFHQQRWLDATFGQTFRSKCVRNLGSKVRNPITVGKYAIRPQNEHFNRIIASDNLENYNIIEQGDFVYDPMSAYYGAFGRYELDEPGIVSPVYRVLRISPGYDTDFLKHFIKSHYIAYQLSAKSSQGNREGKRRMIQPEAFDSISFKIPDIDEQHAIAKVLNACDLELTLLDHKLSLLKKQKHGLMQQLLTGKVRVKT
jgi:type I restriction enzyme, S subunit